MAAGLENSSKRNDSLKFLRYFRFIMDNLPLNTVELTRDPKAETDPSGGYEGGRILDYQFRQRIRCTWDDVVTGTILIFCGLLFCSLAISPPGNNRHRVEWMRLIPATIGISMCWFGKRRFKRKWSKGPRRPEAICSHGEECDVKEARLNILEPGRDVTAEMHYSDDADENEAVDFHAPQSFFRRWDVSGTGILLILFGLFVCLESLLAFNGYYANFGIIEPRFFIATGIGVLVGWRGVRHFVGNKRGRS
jgi:hypothetical protein